MDERDLEIGGSLFRLDEFPVSFAIFALARSHRAKAGALLAKFGLFPGQELLLLNLGVFDGQSQASLTQSLGLDHSTVAKSIARLDRSGFVSRHKSTRDARVTLVFLTDRGRSLLSQIRAAWAELEVLTTAGLTLAEQHTFVELAQRMAANVAPIAEE